MAQTHASRADAIALPDRRLGLRAVPAWAPYLALALLASAVYTQFFYGRGLDVPDEGLLLHVADRLAAGEVPYRDVYFIYTPGWQYLLAGLFRLLGPSLAVAHALTFAVHVALVLVVYGLAARLAWRPLAVAVALVVVASGVSPYRTLVGLLTLWALTRYADARRVRWLVGVGLLVGVSYLVGQEVGMYTLGAALGCLALEWLLPDRWRLCHRIGAVAAGDDEPPAPNAPITLRQSLGRAGLVTGLAAAVVLPWAAIIAVQGALPAMLDDTLRVTFLDQPRYMHVPLPPLWPLAPDDLSTNVVWGPPPYLLYVKLMLYLPLVTVAAAAVLLLLRVLRGDAWARVRPALPLALFATLALGTLAFRADYYHLRQTLPITLVLLAWLLSALRAAALQRGWPRLAASAVLLPLALILAVNAGEAAAQRAWLATPLRTARGTVLLDAATAQDLGALLQALDDETTASEPIYVAPAETAIYFLADRPNPTRFGQLVPTETRVLGEDEAAPQRELIAAVERAGVRRVVTANLDNVDGVPFASYAPLIAAYLDERFEPEQRYGYWTLQQRR